MYNEDKDAAERRVALFDRIGLVFLGAVIAAAVLAAATARADVTLQVPHPTNLVTQSEFYGSNTLNAAAIDALRSRVTTNALAWSFYAVGSSATSLVARLYEAQVITNLSARCDAGAATASVYSVAAWSNDWSTATWIADVVVSATPADTPCRGVVPAGGGVAIAVTDGFAAVTNGFVQIKGVSQ